MSARLYEQYKAKHDSIKPIRGKTVRPIGKRRKQEESIREVVIDGVKGIACHLYNTDCVIYLEDGNILLSSGGYNTHTTRKFIHAQTSFSCTKANNYLWVYVNQPEGHLAVPLPRNGDILRLEPVEGSRYYRIVPPRPILQETVDRTKAKEARAPLMPFLNWAKVMLKMSDGFVAQPSTPQALPDGHPYRTAPSFMNPNIHKEKYQFLCNLKEEEYPKTLELLARVAGVYNFTTDGVYVDFTSLKNHIYRVAENGADCYTHTPAKLGPRPLSNIKF